MVCGHLHARGVRGSQLLLGIRQVLIGHLQLTLRVGLGLLGFRLTRLLILHVLLIRRCLGIQGLLQHLVVVLCVGLAFTQVAQLALSLVLHVLQDLDNASALRLVHLGSRCPKLRVLVLRSLPVLNKGDELLLVSRRKRRCIEHGTKRLQRVGHVGRVQLSQGRGVLRHLLLQDADRAAQNIDYFHQLLLARNKICGFLLADKRCVLQLSLILRNRGTQVLDLGGVHVDFAD
mmetsp:Transcript_55694/g.145254  ORF Transcript_55694/g.145254 Transcript_55694/m.145254 type:complete len:232 (-) Transcript_55694:300-995(-)